jgi:hypothetical protein
MQLKPQELQTLEAFKKASRAAAGQVKENAPFCIFSDVQLPDSSKKLHVLKPFLVVGSQPQVILPMLKDLKGSKKLVASGLCSLQAGKLSLVAKSGKVDYGSLKSQTALFKDLLGKEILIPPPGGAVGQNPADAKTPANKPPDPEVAQRHVKMTEAALHWTGTRTAVDSKINQLKQAVKAHYSKHPAALKEIDKIIVKIDTTLGKLDRRLTDSLKAVTTASPAAHEAELRKTRAILAEYKKVVQSDPLIDHIDKNPFRVKTNLKVTLMDSLNKAEHSMA